MHRGVEIGIHLRDGLSNDAFVAEALANLAAFAVARQRREHLDWQVLRVDRAGGHHYRLVVRHPDRALDLGFERDLRRELDELSSVTIDDLRRRFDAAQRDGLHPVALRHVKETVDFWRDDFWNWLG